MASIKSTRLKSDLKREVIRSLLDAFPDLAPLGRILEKLEKNINDFITRDDTRDSGIARVVDIADRQHWIGRLLVGIQQSEWGDNPRFDDLRKTHPELFNNTVSGNVSVSPQPPSAQSVELNVLVRDRYLVRPYRDMSIHSLDELSAYARLFSHVLVSGPPDMQSTEMFSVAAKLILSSSSLYPLRIDGAPGTGKSTFLSLVYLALEYLCAGDADPIPFYLDLHKFGTVQDAKKTLGMHLNCIKTTIGRQPGRSAILLVDGIDDYTPHAAQLEKLISTFIAKHKQIKKVVGIGLSSITKDPLFGSNVAQSGEAEYRVVLKAIPADPARYEPFVKDFLALQQSGLLATDSELLDKLKLLRLPNIDLLTVSLLLEFHRKALPQPLALSNLYEQYCRSALGDALNDAASLAFRFVVKGEVPSSVAGPWNPAWRLIHWHATMRDFLVAWHVQEQLGRVGTGDLDALKELDYVYPNQISRFSKELVTRSEREETRFLTALTLGFERAGPNARAHMALESARVGSRAHFRSFAAGNVISPTQQPGLGWI